MTEFDAFREQTFRGTEDSKNDICTIKSSILLFDEFASDAFMFFAPKTKTPKQWVRIDVILVMQSPLNCLLFFFH